MLPAVVTVITDKFTIHHKNIISYEGRAIELEPQTRKIVSMIMRRSANKLYTDTETLIDEYLDENYKERVSNKNDATSKYVARCISDARTKCQAPNILNTLYILIRA